MVRICRSLTFATLLVCFLVALRCLQPISRVSRTLSVEHNPLDMKHTRHHHLRHHKNQGNYTGISNAIATLASKLINGEDVIQTLSNYDALEKSKFISSASQYSGTETMLKKNRRYPEDFIDNPHNVSNKYMLDIVFVFEQNTGNFDELFAYWKPIIENYHIIIIGNDDAMHHLVVPTWLKDYESYSVADIMTSLTNHFSPTDDMLPLIKNIGMRSFAGWLSDKELVYVVDNNCYPIDGNVLNVSSSRDHVDLIRQHIGNLKTPSTPDYFNIHFDPYQKESFFSHGFPAHLRGGIFTAVSHGSVLGAQHVDSMTRLLRTDVQGDDRLTMHDVAVTVPYGQLFSMSTANVMFNRELVGPSMFYFRPVDVADAAELAIEHYSDVINGWILKIVADHCSIGVKSGKPYVYRDTSGLNEQQEQLRKDVFSNFTFVNSPEIYQFFHSFKVNSSAETYLTNSECGGRYMRVECVYTELASLMEEQLGRFAYFHSLASTMRMWIRVWQSRNSFLGMVYPIALYHSQFRPSSSSACAAVTIAHNEKDLLPIWLRYHLRHFAPQDIYVLDHLTDDGSLDSLPAGVNKMLLEGNKYVMPVVFRSQAVKIFQDRLLRAGYKCVLFSDTDEMLVPNPLTYPNGLKEYIPRFLQDAEKPAVRVTAYELGHMSYGNGTPSTQEPKLDWSESILKQRHYYSPDRLYNKPLLSKVPLTYRPGFHRLYDIRLDRSLYTDPELVMFHLRSMDNDFCQAREIVKQSMIHQMEPKELATGFASHWNNYDRDKRTGDLCKFAIACFLGPFTKDTKFWDNTGVYPMNRLEAYWSTVNL